MLSHFIDYNNFGCLYILCEKLSNRGGRKIEIDYSKIGKCCVNYENNTCECKHCNILPIPTPAPAIKTGVFNAETTKLSGKVIKAEIPISFDIVKDINTGITNSNGILTLTKKGKYSINYWVEVSGYESKEHYIGLQLIAGTNKFNSYSELGQQQLVGNGIVEVISAPVNVSIAPLKNTISLGLVPTQASITINYLN